MNNDTFSPAKCESGARVRHGDIIMTFGEKNTAYYTVNDPLGIHARPAGALVKLAKTLKSEITFSANGKTAKANSIVNIMSLGAKHGTRLKIEAHGEDEQTALDTVLAFLREHL